MYDIFLKKSLLLFLVWWLAVVTGLNAQTKINYDSLKIVLPTIPAGTSEAALIRVDLANYFVYVNLDSAIYYIDQVFSDASLQAALPKDYHRHFLVKAWTQHGNNQLSDAIENYENAYQLAKLSKIRDDRIEVLINLGAAIEQNRDTSAMDFVNGLMTELDTSVSEADQVAYILGHQYRANIFSYKDQQQKALNVLLRVFEIPFLYKYPQYSVGVYKAFANNLKKIGNFTTSEKFLKEAIKIGNISDFDRRSSLLNLIDLYARNEQLDSARVYLSAFEKEKNLTGANEFDYLLVKAKYFMESDSLMGALDAFGQLKILVAGMNNEDKELTVMIGEGQVLARIGEINKAENLLRRIKILFQKKPHLVTENRKIACTEIEINTALWRKNPRTVEAFKEYQQLTKAKTRRQTDKKLHELSVSYESEEKENQLKMVQQQNLLQAQNILLNNWLKVALGVLVLLLTALLYIFYNRSTLKTTQLQADNEALSSRMNEMSTKLESQEISENVLLEKIEVNTYNKQMWVSLDEIMYLTVKEEDTYIYLCNDEPTIRSSETLKSFSAKLPHPPFVQIFRNTIINKHKMKARKGNLVFMEDGQELKVSKTFKNNL